MKPRRREELWSPKRVRDGMGLSRSRHAKHGRRRARRLSSLSVAALASAVTVGTPASASAGPPRAHAARVLNVHDEGRLHYVKSSGELIIDEGHASGTFPGPVKVRFLYNGEPTVSAHFTISGSSGSIFARGSGRLSSPTSPAPSFHGSFTVTGGSGRYSHVHGSGQLYGVYYRRSYALTVQAIGKLPY
jgi:hypothetical protein